MRSIITIICETLSIIFGKFLRALDWQMGACKTTRREDVRVL